MPIEFKTIRSTLQKYFAVFGPTGWKRKYRAAAGELMQAVSNSQFVVAAYGGEQLIGVDRVLTEGVLHAMLYDVVVVPLY